jgi:hypothetical protein
VDENAKNFAECRRQSTMRFGSIEIALRLSFEHDLRATRSAFVARESRYTLFRIMLQKQNGAE